MNIPKPTKMPSNAMIREDRLSLVNFINSYYIYRDITRCTGARKILIIGPGQGLDTEILKCRGFDVTTLDIDDAFTSRRIG